MENYQELVTLFGWLIPVIAVLVIWDTTWKLVGMWKAARNNELAWFICIAVFNTIGVLPIIYILLNKKKTEEEE